jgi:hypothetical protein
MKWGFDKIFKSTDKIFKDMDNIFEEADKIFEETDTTMAKAEENLNVSVILNKNIDLKIAEKTSLVKWNDEKFLIKLKEALNLSPNDNVVGIRFSVNGIQAYLEGKK